MWLFHQTREWNDERLQCFCKWLKQDVGATQRAIDEELDQTGVRGDKSKECHAEERKKEEDSQAEAAPMPHKQNVFMRDSIACQCSGMLDCDLGKSKPNVKDCNRTLQQPAAPAADQCQNEDQVTASGAVVRLLCDRILNSACCGLEHSDQHKRPLVVSEFEGKEGEIRVSEVAQELERSDPTANCTSAESGKPTHGKCSEHGTGTDKPFQGDTCCNGDIAHPPAVLPNDQALELQIVKAAAAASCLSQIQANRQASTSMPWPYYFIATRDCFTYQLLPVRTKVWFCVSTACELLQNYSPHSLVTLLHSFCQFHLQLAHLGLLKGLLLRY